MNLKNHSKWLIIALSIVMGLFVLAGCGGGGEKSGEEGDVVKIGFLGPITGANAAEGSAARNAFELAMNDANKSGELPFKIKVVPMDDASKPETGAAAAESLTSDPDVIGMSGHWNSPVAEATIPIAVRSEIPMVIWGAIKDGLTSEENYPYITRVCPTEKQENEPLAKAVLGDMGYKNIYIISDLTSYGKGNTEVFKQKIKEYGANLVGVEEIQTGTNDFRPILANIKNKDVDAIYFGGVVNEAGLVKRQMTESGMDDVLLFGISGICSEDYFTAAGKEAAEGTFSIKPGVDPASTEVGQTFLEEYKAANYREPVGAFTPYAYDAAQVIIAALKECKDDPTAENLTDAIAKVKSEGLLGTTTFDKIGQTTNPASYSLVAQDGEWIPFDKSEYASGARHLPGKTGDDVPKTGDDAEKTTKDAE